jgi:Glycosyl hydrolase family 26
LTDLRRSEGHRRAQSERLRTPGRRHWPRLLATIVVVSLVAAIVATYAVHGTGRPARAKHSEPQRERFALPTTPGSYIGLYPDGVPKSYAGVTAFTVATGVRPNVVLYYSGWLEPFHAAFAAVVAQDGAVPLVQIEPKGINLAAIASGHYDSYLSAYATAVRAYHHPVILSFGHEMNGSWYSWGYRHTSPALFVAAWRHIVTLFRALGAINVTWLWTVNTIHSGHGVPSPRAWWPGSSYVTWVGIDGYYSNQSAIFASLFGPTIVAVRTLTHDPILIAETAAAPATEQPAKIADLFAGIHLYGLLGFVWFDTVAITNWTISSTAAIASFRRAAEIYRRRAS